ncbi:MAG: sporulation transcription factor Spo0A [Clostridiales bacterium]|nr:sporulation transcription factor Spo0A [Clostridiales bacterium]
MEAVATAKRPIRILIADDNREFSHVLATYLNSQEDFEVVGIAQNGREVLDYQGTPPDLVLLDIVMPYLDGLGVVEHLRRKHAGSPPKIIMLTAFGQESITKRAAELGIDYYILKPFDLATLAHRIRQLLQEPSAGPIVKREEGDLERRIGEILHQVGIPAHIRGYRFLKDAIAMVYSDVHLLEAVTKELYPSVARRHRTTPSRVERAIRHAIEVGWNRGSYEVIEAIFAHTVRADRGKPTNSEFIAMVADYLRSQG